MGIMIINEVEKREYKVIMGEKIVIGECVIIVNIMKDMEYEVIDKRIKVK